MLNADEVDKETMKSDISVAEGKNKSTVSHNIVDINPRNRGNQDLFFQFF